LIQELEELINSSTITEHQLQTFFERNPEFLCGDTYESARPHIVLQRPHEGPLIPDFALKPNNANALCDLLELKLPTAKLLTGKDNRKRLSAALLEACAQLREYRDFFEQDRNRREIDEVYGLRFFRPRMMVVIGKRSEYLASDLRKAEGDVPQLLITTYDDLLDRARSRLRPYSHKVLSRGRPQDRSGHSDDGRYCALHDSNRPYYALVCTSGPPVDSPGRAHRCELVASRSLTVASRAQRSYRSSCRRCPILQVCSYATIGLARVGGGTTIGTDPSLVRVVG
jgi:hypothetical protein